MTQPNGQSTAVAVSPDSGEHWSAPGAWRVAEGVYRIPLPLPMDGLKAVNVYAIEGEDGYTLIDGGWAITEGRAALEQGLKQLDAGFGDIKRFYVTHIHRDHYTLASVLGGEVGAQVALGEGERASLDMIHHRTGDNTIARSLAQAGATAIAEQWSSSGQSDDPTFWRLPDVWLEGDVRVPAGERTLDAVHTPGHTRGHYVFADADAGLLFAGDHVLPTITPSIGFESSMAVSPLGDFMASLTKVRGLPDRTLLPAHGPVSPSTHARVDQLLAHHEERLDLCVAALRGGEATSVDIAGQLPWTRHEHAFSTLDFFNQGLAAMETKAHLELLVARGQVSREERDGIVHFELLPA
ncbi:MBL fold metallo-hydrolase [Nocardioides insulae]|uniref:MBL fold metallo-hydrolase n=1 Tax=Nocardioides insulae TaxID=394734 RepID=UPI00040325D2|nr:MBL fold metallo-hydrolase [Nocardioides insulae]